jgi:drug/metabolite transporter (DMT)-like permease
MPESLARPVAGTPTEKSQPGPDRNTLIAFAAFVLVGGGAALTIRFIYGELEPFWSGVLRFGFAAIIFLVLMVIRKVPLPRGRALVGAVLFGALSGIALLLMYYGLTQTPASLFQTLAAIMPLMTLLFAAAHRLEPLRRRGVAGGLLAVVGIAIAVSGSLSTGVALSLPHVAAIFVGVACLAEGGIVIKLFPPSHPYATNLVAMTIAASIMGAGSLLMGETWILPTEASTWLALLYIVVGATVGGFLLYFYMLKNWTATGASYGFVLTPIVTVILASVLTEETISPIFVAGAAVVLAGVYVGALMPAKKVPPSVKDLEPVATQQNMPEPVTGEPVPALSTGEGATTDDIQARPGMPNCI